MHRLTEEQLVKWKVIQPLLEAINLETDTTALKISAYSSIAAAGGDRSELAMKLLLLSHKGIIDYDEFMAFIFHHSTS